MRGYPGQREPREVTLEKMRARSRRLREADPDRIRVMARANYWRNREAIRERQAAAYAANPAKHIAREKAWREANPDKYYAAVAKRLIARETGMRIRDVPDELASLKALEMRIKRHVQALATTESIAGGGSGEG